VLAASAVLPNVLLHAVNALEKSEHGVCLPVLERFLKHEVGHTVRGTNACVKVEVDVEKSDALEWTLHRGESVRKDKVARLGSREDARCRGSNVDSANRAEVVRKGQDVPPEAVGRKLVRKQLSIASDGRTLNSAEPPLGDNQGVDVSGRREAGLVGREVCREGRGGRQSNGHCG